MAKLALALTLLVLAVGACGGSHDPGSDRGNSAMDTHRDAAADRNHDVADGPQSEPLQDWGVDAPPDMPPDIVPEPGCGDSVCEMGLAEDACTCPADCGAAPLMELNCSDGNDNDCDNDVDCADVDCSALSACQCGLKADPCLTDSNCCSNKCRGKPDAKTCK